MSIKASWDFITRLLGVAHTWTAQQIFGNIDVNGGAIDGTPIGANSASTGVFTTVNTGQGANELYGMDQNVKTDSSPSFVGVTTTGFNSRSVTSGITASTTQTQGQGALTSEINEVSVCANANDTVTLPAAAIGRICLVVNNGANTLQIFPASGDNLGQGVDTATTLAAGSNVSFVAFDATNWEVM